MIAVEEIQSGVMFKFRFHIASLLGMILFFGVGFAALREATDLWQVGIFTLVILGLLVATLLAIHSTERRRAFWLGFALFGWVSLAATLVPSIESRLITTKALAFLDSKVDRLTSGVVEYADLDNDGSFDLFVVNRSAAMAVNNTFVDVSSVAGSSGSPKLAGRSYTILKRWLTRPAGTTENFMRMGHSLLVLGFAFLGGQLSRYLYRRHRESTPAIAERSTGDPGR
jgi:hypothetical protein